MYPVAILAGGLATRLGALTASLPKALVNVAGKPFIFWQLEFLRMQGVSKVVICIGHLGEMIREAVGRQGNFGLEISFSCDGHILRGTGGAIKKAIPLLGQRFFILYGDSFLPIRYLDVQNAFEMKNATALMTVLKNDNRWDKSNVFYRDGIVVKYDKVDSTDDMSYIDYGLSIVSSSIFEYYSESSAFDLSDVFAKLSATNSLNGYEVFERFYEIGSRDGIRETEEYLLSGRYL